MLQQAADRVQTHLRSSPRNRFPRTTDCLCFHNEMWVCMPDRCRRTAAWAEGHGFIVLSWATFLMMYLLHAHVVGHLHADPEPQVDLALTGGGHFMMLGSTSMPQSIIGLQSSRCGCPSTDRPAAREVTFLVTQLVTQVRTLDRPRFHSPSMLSMW